MGSLEQVSFGEGAESNKNRSCALITALITSVQMNVSKGAVSHLLKLQHLFESEYKDMFPFQIMKTCHEITRMKMADCICFDMMWRVTFKRRDFSDTANACFSSAACSESSVVQHKG